MVCVCGEGRGECGRGGGHFFTPIFNVKFVNRGNIQVGNVRVSISFRAYQVGMTVAVVIV